MTASESDIVAAVVVVDVAVNVTDDEKFVVDVGDGVAAGQVSFGCKPYHLNLEAFSEGPCVSESVSVDVLVYVECVDGGRWCVEEWNVGNMGNVPLIPGNHDDDEYGNEFDLNSLFLHHYLFCYSSVVEVVVVDVAAVVSLGTSPTDCPVLLHFLSQRQQR